MREVFGEILMPFFDILDIANAISLKVQVLEARHF